ncbi:hypothetical protein H310_03834 [Aphanomyces invadans]|uniref:Dienelactone hydrolase domain-containing protein n=1 Tax=Aphanomyces invadans TaxID=157072 RepID=A0A024UEN4_9STRA|nr:hypothetical protein H310_03834 [Aphanomyces invadans]ETW04670.1 hypothetical protein H310_03834 [Aphanomyces invadans]RHY23450.1 hypothetical protein DYB32_009192 [Aphanomyces invadans]|eukprot:XP_008866108.1 hypothetical protein H310_03834 [Aphanomyces invadans]
MSCCPPNSLPANPTTSNATPIKVGNTDVFFYDNAATSTLVLVFPDVFGPDSGRTKENCVNLSAHYKVALVDLTTDYVADLSNVGAWIKDRPFEGLVGKIEDVVAHFQTNHGVTKFGALGYCWGAWVVAKYSAFKSTVLSAGISFHPSWAAEQLFHGEGSGAKIAESITVPQLILAAGNDPAWLKPGGEVEKTLEARGIAHKLREFPSVAHGWVNRGDLNDATTAEAFHAAWFDEALPFLQQHLK